MKTATKKSRPYGGLIATLVAVSAVALAACNPQTTQNMKAETKDMAATAKVAVDDSVITTKVKTAMLADDQVKGLDISVDTKDGVVTLNGKASPSAKQRAVQIAKNVEGVHSVIDSIVAN